MSDSTPILGLPLLVPGQAQKEMYHNEAVAMLEIATAAPVEAVGLSSPPATPGLGQSWILGASPSGDWSGHAGALASWTEAGWRLVAPVAGMQVWSLADQLVALFDGADWRLGQVLAAEIVIGGNRVIGAQGGPIDSPAGGDIVDSEARETIDAILAALRDHGLIAE